MPKAAGAPLKPLRVANPRPVAVKPIKLQSAADGPQHRGIKGNLVDTGPAARNIKSGQQVY
jgi:hypothetical protein